jgi:hypothetical protein
MTLSSWQPAQKAAATTTSTPTTPNTATTPGTAMTPSTAMTPTGAAPGKAQAPVSSRAVTKPGVVVDRPATSAATSRSASGSKRDKIEATNDGDERSEESTGPKTRRAQRATDATRGADDDSRSARKRGLENIGRMLEAMHRMRPNFFSRWR